MKATIVDCGSAKVPDIIRCAEKSGFRTEIVALADVQPHLITDAVIVSGAPILLTETDPAPYLEKFKVLMSMNKPMLCICFGHQLLGMTHGAIIKKCEPHRSWEYMRTFGLYRLFSYLYYPFLMMKDHTEEISLPVGWLLLASSDNVVVEAMRHPDKPWYGVQFHPEVSGGNGQQLFDNFRVICSKVS
jgi:GMP synthase (glutamine-hydrolysing)